MFKFETIGVSFVISCLLALPSLAESTSTSGTTVSLGGGNPYALCVSKLEIRAQICKDMCKDAKGAELTKCLADKTKCLEDAEAVSDRCQKDAAAPRCYEATKEYNKAKGEFVGACSTAHLSSSPAGGHIGCSETLQKCNPLEETGGTEYEEATTSAELYNIPAEEKRMKACKLNAVTDHKDLREEIKEARKNKKEAKAEIPKIEEEMTDAQRKATEDAEKLAQEFSEENKKHAQALKEAKRALEAEQNGLGEQITGLQGQLDTLDEQIAQLKMSKTEAANKYEEALTNIDMGCQSTALQQVAKLQEIELMKIRDRKLPNHTFKSLLKRVGVSDRQAWQRVADDRYQLCMQSKSVRQTIQSARRTRDTLLENADTAIANVEKRKAAVRQQIEEIRPKNGCPNVGQILANGANNMPKMCQAVSKAIEDQNNAEVEHRQTLAQLAQKQQNAATVNSQNQMRLNKKLSDATKEFNEEEARLNNLERFYSLKKQMAGGTTNVDSKDIGEVRNKYGSLIAAAGDYLTSCKCSETQPEGELCAGVKAFYKAQDREVYTETAQINTEPTAELSRGKAGESATPRTGPSRTTSDGSTPKAGASPATPGGQR